MYKKISFEFVVSLIVFVVLVGGCQSSNVNVPCSGECGQTVTSNCPTGSYTCVTLTWNASTTSGVSYHVWYGTGSEQYTTEDNAGTNLTYQVTNLSPGTYYFAVTAYNSSGESGYSNEAMASIPVTTLSEITARGETLVNKTSIVIPSYTGQPRGALAGDTLD